MASNRSHMIYMDEKRAEALLLELKKCIDDRARIQHIVVMLIEARAAAEPALSAELMRVYIDLHYERRHSASLSFADSRIK